MQSGRAGQGSGQPLFAWRAMALKAGGFKKSGQKKRRHEAPFS